VHSVIYTVINIKVLLWRAPTLSSTFTVLSGLSKTLHGKRLRLSPPSMAFYTVPSVSLGQSLPKHLCAERDQRWETH